jgi:phenylacetate-coenzyme A ligase PaaK-like adenylate-forming protein
MSVHPLHDELRLAAEARAAVTERLRRVVSVHFDPVWGSRFWLDRAAALGIDGLRHLHTIEDLELLGEMTPGDLRTRPLLDYVPRRFHARLDELVIAQTGGTTGGRGQWTAYRDDEFIEAFVLPFVVAASALQFPAGQQWLFVGPSGPHIIGKAVRHLAAAFGSAEPFAVDFDPRWAKKLPPDSFARQRYLAHVIEQAMAVIETQEIGVLFTTPPVLAALAELMTQPRRERIRAVHYGGLVVTPQQMKRFQEELFPNALHLSGYGNTLFGCCMELSAAAGREIDYFPFGQRLLFEVVDRDDDGEGAVRFTRLDETGLIVHMHERDVARLVEPPGNAPGEFVLPGLRNPHPPPALDGRVALGLY